MRARIAAGPLRDFLRGFARQSEAANDGASHLGAEDYSDHPDRLRKEESIATPII